MQFPCQTHEGRGWWGGRWKVAEVARSRELTPAGHQVQPQLKVKAKSFASCACNDPFQLTLILSLSLSFMRLLSLSPAVWLEPACLAISISLLHSQHVCNSCCLLLFAVRLFKLPPRIFVPSQKGRSDEWDFCHTLSLSLYPSLSASWNSPLKLDSKVKFLPRVEWMRVVG